MQWVALVSALQLATAPAFQARVMSLMEAVGAAAPGIGFALGGVLAATLGPRAAFAAAAAGAALATIAFALTEGQPSGDPVCLNDRKARLHRCQTHRWPATTRDDDLVTVRPPVHPVTKTLAELVAANRIGVPSGARSGASRARTDGLRRAMPALSQLSYSPKLVLQQPF